MSNIKNFLSEAVSTIPSWQQWCYCLILFLSSLVSSENVSRIDVKLLCHGITLRQAQICPDLPSLSEPALSAIACDVCRQGSFGFNFKVFYSVFLLHFVPLALRLHTVRACKRSTFSGWCSLDVKKKEWRVVSIGPLSSFIGVVHLTALVEVSEALKPSRAGDIKPIIPRGITSFPSNILSLSPGQHTVWSYSNPHFSPSSSPSWDVFSLTEASDGFPVQRLLHLVPVARWLLVSAKARRWEGKAVESCPGFSFLDWRARFFLMKTEQGRRGSETIYSQRRSQRGKSHNGALTMQRPILVLESALWLMCFGGAGGSVWYCITPPDVCWNLRLLQPFCASLVVCSPSTADSSQDCLWEQELELR